MEIRRHRYYNGETPGEGAGVKNDYGVAGAVHHDAAKRAGVGLEHGEWRRDATARRLEKHLNFR